ncbi:MAG: hypothetical protein P4L33_05790 [Capsulimonadaceae bacterium]|nr:hypothetical protein [Capsulimonadaceae bacterium]
MVRPLVSSMLSGRNGAMHAVRVASREPLRTTTGSENEQLLYFTSTSLSDDARSLVVIVGGPDGAFNLASYDLQSGARRMLTSHAPGYLKSYVYFDGQPYTGFGRASVSFDSARRVLYYVHGRHLMAAELDGGLPRMLAELPDDQVTAFTHVSADGAQLCVPTTDARALADDVLAGDYATGIDETVQREGLYSFLNIFDAETGASICNEPVERAWVTHVQFSPATTDYVVYNHEWPADCGIRRVWLWDRSVELQIRMRPESAERSREDWACHETWERDGSHIIYHGGYRNDGPAFIGRVSPETGRIEEIAFPAKYTPYGHFTTGRPGWLVTDGYYVSETGKIPGNWLTLLHVDWDNHAVEWYPLCPTGSSWRSQDAHPHPIFDGAGTTVYFTSDADGKLAVYKVDVSDIVDE